MADTPRSTNISVVPLRHPGHWLASAAVLFLIFLVARSVITNDEFQWDVAGKYLFHPTILHGLWITTLLTVIVMIVAVMIGSVVAVMSLSRSPLLWVPAAFFNWFFRGVPALVQLILWFNLSLLIREISITLPYIGTIWSVKTNDFMTPFFSAVVALSLHEGGYMAEIIRAGINSVSAGQAEAGSTLGMRRSAILRRIILPQAMRLIIPPTGNVMIGLLKVTSLVSVIAVADLLQSAQRIYTRTFETIPLLMVVTFWYLVAVTIMSFGQYYLEQHFSKDDRRVDKRSFLTVLTDSFRFRKTKG